MPMSALFIKICGPIERDGSPNQKDKIRPCGHRFERNLSLGFLQYVPISWNILHLKISVDDVARQGLLLPDRVRESSYLAIGTQCIRPEDTFGV